MNTEHKPPAKHLCTESPGPQADLQVETATNEQQCEDKPSDIDSDCHESTTRLKTYFFMNTFQFSTPGPFFCCFFLSQTLFFILKYKVVATIISLSKGLI